MTKSEKSGPENITRRKAKCFLAALIENYGNVTAACQQAGLTVTQVVDLEVDDEDFARALGQARILGLCALEDEARRRAMDGVEKPVFYQGSQCGVIRDYSDTLLMFLLKNGLPDKYRDKAAGPDGDKPGAEVLIYRMPDNER